MCRILNKYMYMKRQTAKWINVYSRSIHICGVCTGTKYKLERRVKEKETVKSGNINKFRCCYSWVAFGPCKIIPHFNLNIINWI